MCDVKQKGKIVTETTAHTRGLATVSPILVMPLPECFTRREDGHRNFTKWKNRPAKMNCSSPGWMRNPSNTLANTLVNFSQVFAFVPWYQCSSYVATVVEKFGEV
jgi:hypothetical protein